MTRRVLCLYTGGTIGMVSGTSGLIPDPDFESAVRDAVPSFDFQWQQTQNLFDSSAMGPQDWSAIAKVISDKADAFDAFVVLHGTDTMAYTAAALGFALRGLNKPIVVTGSQIPLRSNGTDAADNLTLALNVAHTSHLKGALIAFGGVVLRGTRALKSHAQAFAAFTSPNHPPLAWQLTQDAMVAPVTSATQIRPVGLIRLTPGLSSAVIDSFAIYNGVVLEAYGSGNFPGPGSEVYTALARLQAQGVAICVTTQCGAGQVAAGTYAAGAGVTDLGLIPLSDMTATAAVVKMGWLLAQGLNGAELATDMRRACAHEISG